jgi:Tfp pilus assembly protein PilX
MSPSSLKHESLEQRGMTLILTLLLMLSLTMMASAIISVVNNHADLTSSVTQKPIAMKTADSCVDQAVVWLLTPTGAAWATSGIGTTTDLAASGGILYGKSLTDDTAKKASADTRTDKFKARTTKSTCTSVILTILAEESSEASGGTGVGAEAGTEASYDADAAVSGTNSIIKVVAEGIFNTPTLLGGTVVDKSEWQAGSSRGKVEVVLEYQQ